MKILSVVLELLLHIPTNLIRMIVNQNEIVVDSWI